MDIGAVPKTLSILSLHFFAFKKLSIETLVVFIVWPVSMNVSWYELLALKSVVSKCCILLQIYTLWLLVINPYLFELFRPTEKNHIEIYFHILSIDFSCEMFLYHLLTRSFFGVTALVWVLVIDVFCRKDAKKNTYIVKKYNKKEEQLRTRALIMHCLMYLKLHLAICFQKYYRILRIFRIISL